MNPPMKSPRSVIVATVVSAAADFDTVVRVAPAMSVDAVMSDASIVVLASPSGVDYGISQTNAPPKNEGII